MSSPYFEMTSLYHSKTPINMKFTLILLFLTSILLPSFSQEAPMPTDISWSDIKLDSVMPANPISQVIVISDRRFTPEEEILFLDGKVSKTGLNYFVASEVSDGWVLSPIFSTDDIKTVVDNSKNSIFFVHGYGKTFTQTLLRGSQVSKRFNLNTVIYDWPAKKSIFYNAQHYARKNAVKLSTAVKEYNNYFMTHGDDSKYNTLFMHSLGNYLFSHYIKNDRAAEETDLKTFDNIVLNAPAIKQKYMHMHIDTVGMSHNVIVTLNNNDMILRGAGVATLSTQVGNKIKKDACMCIKYVDFTPIANRKHTVFTGYNAKEDSQVKEIYNDIFNNKGIDVTKGYVTVENGNWMTVVAQEDESISSVE